MPGPDDEVELGVIALDSPGEFKPFARTRAWNFQQGAMLQWLGDGTGRVFYTSLGHRDDVIDPKADIGDAEFKVRYNPPATALMVQKHILSGIRWALGLTQADATLGTR